MTVYSLVTSFPNLETVRCSTSGFNWWILIAYRFLRRQVRRSGIPISFKDFPQFVVIHTVKGFNVVNEAEVGVFLNCLATTLAWRIPWTEKPGRLQSMGSQRGGHDWATSLHFFYDPMDFGNLIFGSSIYSKTSLYVWSSQFMYCWNLAWKILSIIFLACEMSTNVW